MTMELFQSKILPKLDGELQIRDGKKSGWKKYMFSLRASGLYYSKTGKSLASKDISRLVEWKDVECYTGTQYKKFYRAPGQFCFSLVPNGPLHKVEKQIIHLCVPSKHELLAWLTGIRLAKHSVQLQQDYEDTRAEMPWLQLEEESLDEVKSPLVKTRKPEMEMPTIMVNIETMKSNGKEVGAVDTVKKPKTFRGSLQTKTESLVGSIRGSILPTEASQQLTDRSHIISGPLGEGGSGTGRRNRANQSMLASVFQNAWKQGNLAAEMNQDAEKWPVFNQSPRSSMKNKSHENLHTTGSLPYVLEGGDTENSGMYTLRKKKKDKENNRDLPQVASTESRNDINRTLQSSVEAVS